jgi:hypothetical protein
MNLCGKAEGFFTTLWVSQYYKSFIYSIIIFIIARFFDLSCRYSIKGATQLSSRG